MSILIKGMEMPKNCLQCDCTDTEYGECVLDPGKRCPDDYKKRADWCPLVPVPPHGRLIDADALMKRISHMNMEAYMDGACYGIHPSLEYLDLLNEILDDAPTIIPADPAEEGE